MNNINIIDVDRVNKIMIDVYEIYLNNVRYIFQPYDYFTYNYNTYQFVKYITNTNHFLAKKLNEHELNTLDLMGKFSGLNL